jgi:hypothetical protein
MSANQQRRLYSVWKNGTDEIVAICLPADKCAELMGITRQAFYTYLKRPCKTWHIERSGMEDGNAENT